MKKIVQSAAQAIADIRDDAVIAVSGFGLCGNPEALINAIAASGRKNLTLISNNAGNQGKGLAQWLRAGVVGRVICSYLGNNEDLHTRMADGSLEVTVVPQGTLVERLRAAGAGIPAFYTRTGVGTVVAAGKRCEEIDGVTCVLEHSLQPDFAFVRAAKADPFGNLRFYRTAQNFAPVMAMAAKVTICEADEVVALGDIDPDDVHLPGVFVDRIVHVPDHENAIEYLTTRDE